MAIRRLHDLLPGLPLPLAQLGRRVLHAKIAVDRHAAAYCLAEATVKLAAAARIGLYLAQGHAPGALGLERLLDATMARWCVLLDEVGQALVRLPDAALLPLAEATEQLTRSRPEWTAVAALTDHVEKQGVIEATLARRSRGRGLVGALTVIAARGPSLSPSEAKPEDGELLVAAVTELLSSPALFGELQLARVAALGPLPKWESLTGFAPQPLVVERPSAAEVGAGRLYFVGPGARIALHPLVAAREDGYGGLQVGFLNRTVRRTRKGLQGSVQELRRIDFLDYASGELFADADAEEALRRLFSSQGHTEAATAAFQYPTPDREGRDEDHEVLEANTVVGDFQLLSELGKGGMGVVYKATQLSVRRKVALKVLPASLAEDPVMISRFQREVAALQRCDHPNVVKVLTSGSDAGRHYYAMELVVGANLAQTLRVLSKWRTPSTGPLKEGHIQAAVTRTGRPSLSAEDPALAVTAAIPAATSDARAAEALPLIAEGRPIETRLAELFADAASGLAHLHEAGVIHRDIKPANLMLTIDAQRIVIMDLGVARLDDESRALTSADVKILGTLRYMPPEQLDRQRDALDHRADLYSLGVTLYELATGHHFFDGESDEEIIQQILNGEPAPPRQVAPHLNRDLATILQVATAKLPAKRYQSARALEADLRAVAANRPIQARPPGVMERLGQWVRHHRPAVTAAAAVMLIALLSVVWRQHQSQLCRGAEERLSGAWDQRIKEAVKTAFLATGRTYAAAAFQSVETTLDARARAWAAMHREACEATRLRGEQSELLLDRRISCLAERREEMRTLGDVFSHADVPVVERAVAAAEGLSPLSGCADGQALLARMAPPRDAQAVAKLREEIARTKALDQAGRFVEGLTRIRAAVTAAKALDYQPLVAEALFMQGRLEDASSAYDAAERSLYEAWWAAEAAGHDEIKARAASHLVYLVGYLKAHHQEALQLDRHAQAVDQRLGNRPELEAGRHNNLGAVLRAMGDYDRALAEFQQSLDIKQRLDSPDQIEIAETLNNLGNVLDDKGDQPKALEALGRALAIRQKVLGPDHPEVAHTLNNLGVVYHNQGDDARAFDHYQRAMAIEERSLGPDDPSVAGSLTNLGGLLSARGDRDQALAYHRRALAIWEKTLGPDHPNTGITVNNIGEELRYRHRYEEALALYDRALAIFQKAVGPDHPAVAMVLSNIGQARLGRREYRPASAALERVFAICDKKTCEPAVLSESSFAMAEVLWQLGQRERARSFATRAREIYAKSPASKDKLEEIATWLSRHG